jgi:hypothetical protein
MGQSRKNPHFTERGPKMSDRQWPIERIERRPI